jgi:hypothetical protein
MSNLRAQLQAQLARFDDDAFAALANRGLLRRAQKDLEKQNATLLEESADALTLALGEHRIRFDARGPAHAQCSCPAADVCQHILAAAISLQRLPADDEPQTAPAASEEDPLAPLHAALLRIAASELARHAGKPGYRWAWQFVLDLDPEEGLQIGGERHIVIRFSHPRISFRYMGGGLESLVADVAVSQIEKYRVAAVLAYQRAHGIEMTPPEPSARDRSASLDLGKDHAAPEPAEHGQHASRARLRAGVKQLIEECIALGLSHLSRGIHERYATLAVWAQGAEYHRLALLLRRLADHVELLLERAGSADEHVLLDEMTLAFGLVCALDDAATRKLEPASLVGRARTQYEEAGKLDLLGLGASAWRSASGYVGLTMVFWSPQDQAFLSCTDARPENQRGFNPVARYKAAGPWSGLGAPAQATGRRILLNGAQLNATGRLSSAESVNATVQSAGTGTDFAQQLQPCKSWPELAQARRLARRSLLAEPQPMKDWAALLPARFGAAKFDAARQTLVWPLFDENDQRLDAELPYSAQTAHAIVRIEQIRPEQLAAGTLLVAHVRNGLAGPVAAPLSLVRPHAAPAENPVDALYFDAPPEQGFASKLLDRINRLGSAKASAEEPLQPSSRLPQALRELRHCLQQHAERGIPADHAEQSLARMTTLGEKASAAGLTAFSRLVSAGAVVRLLQMHYLCLQYERLIEEAGDSAARAMTEIH